MQHPASKRDTGGASVVCSPRGNEHGLESRRGDRLDTEVE